MKHVDMRKLAPAAQEERRRQVIGLRQSGVSYAAIAAQVGLSQTGVFDICQRFDAQGETGLVSGKRGRKPDEQKRLTTAQETEIKRLICRHMPDDLGLDFALWSREAVRALIRRQSGVRLAVRTTGKYLARWGFTAQKPLRRAYEPQPAAVREWLHHEYPAIVARARRQRGVVFWGDETGLRGDDVRGRAYAPRGQTPVVRPSGFEAVPSDVYDGAVGVLEDGPVGEVHRLLERAGSPDEEVVGFRGVPYIVRTSRAWSRVAAERASARFPQYAVELGLRCAASGTSRRLWSTR